jgi:hypothetical protein
LKNDGKKRKLLFVMNKATKMAKFGLKMFYSTRGVLWWWFLAFILRYFLGVFI